MVDVGYPAGEEAGSPVSSAGPGPAWASGSLSGWKLTPSATVSRGHPSYFEGFRCPRLVTTGEYQLPIVW